MRGGIHKILDFLNTIENECPWEHGICESVSYEECGKRDCFNCWRLEVNKYLEEGK